MNYFGEVRPTYLEQWPEALRRLSIDQVDVPLTVDDARRLGRNMMELFECFDEVPDPSIDHIRGKIAVAMEKFPGGAFLRLGSRSPKDCWDGYREGFKVMPSDPDPLRFVLGCSERMSEDLLLAIRNEYPPHLFVRRWADIPPWAEFRCFMMGRRLVGISQYHYRQFFPELLRHESLILWAVECFFIKNFRSASHLDHVVFDVFVTIREQGDEAQAEVKLLEINPFFALTDPCLFDHRSGGDFDGSFRIVEKPLARKAVGL